jgi:hypothetical protein
MATLIAAESSACNPDHTHRTALGTGWRLIYFVGHVSYLTKDLRLGKSYLIPGSSN